MAGLLNYDSSNHIFVAKTTDYRTPKMVYSDLVRNEVNICSASARNALDGYVKVGKLQAVVHVHAFDRKPNGGVYSYAYINRRELPLLRGYLNYLRRYALRHLLGGLWAEDTSWTEKKSESDNYCRRHYGDTPTGAHFFQLLPSFWSMAAGRAPHWNTIIAITGTN